MWLFTNLEIRNKFLINLCIISFIFSAKAAFEENFCGVCKRTTDTKTKKKKNFALLFPPFFDFETRKRFVGNFGLELINHSPSWNYFTSTPTPNFRESWKRIYGAKKKYERWARRSTAASTHQGCVVITFYILRFSLYASFCVIYKEIGINPRRCKFQRKQRESCSWVGVAEKAFRPSIIFVKGCRVFLSIIVKFGFVRPFTYSYQIDQKFLFWIKNLVWEILNFSIIFWHDQWSIPGSRQKNF